MFRRKHTENWPVRARKNNTPSPKLKTPSLPPELQIPVIDTVHPDTVRTTDPLTIWKTQPALRKVVSFIARQVASIPWHAYQRVDDTDRRRIATSPAERILEKPATLVTGYRLLRDLVTDLLISDHACAILTDGELV